MGIKQEIAPYRDRHGLIHPTSQKNSLNGLIYLGYYIGILYRLGELRLEDSLSFRETVKKVSLEPGLLCRSPGVTNQEAVDDYFGVVCAAAITKRYSVAKEIRKFGLRNKLEVGPISLPFYYNNEKPGTQLDRDGNKNWNAWLGRFPTLRVMLRWASGFKRTRIERCIWSLECLYTAIASSRTDPMMMLWLKMQAFGSNELNDIVTKIMKKRNLKFKQFFAEYFGAQHPITLYIPD